MEAHEIFEKAIRTWWAAGSPIKGEAKTYNQLAFWVFGSGNAENSSKVARALASYSMYFERVGQSELSAKWNPIDRDHGELTGNPRPRNGNTSTILKALEDERKAAYAQSRQTKIAVEFMQQLPNQLNGGKILFSCSLVREDNNLQEIQLDQGQRLTFHASKDYVLRFTVGDLLESQGTLYLVAASAPRERVPTKGTLRLDTGNFSKRKSERVRAILEHPGPLFGVEALFSPLNWFSTPAKQDISIYDLPGLNVGQRLAVRKALNRRLSAVWGPPGTGKTHTLARHILSLALAGQRVLVTAVANVALDEVAARILQISEHCEHVKALLDKQLVLRLGYPKNPVVAGDERLYANLKAIRQLTTKICRTDEALATLNKKLTRAPTDEELRMKRLVLTVERTDLVGQRHKEVAKSIDTKRVVFVTTAMCFQDSKIIESADFDAVLIDEASMVSRVEALGAAVKAKRWLSFYGDFQQLPPVVQSKTKAAREWLAKDLFDTCDLVDTSKQPVRIREQARSLVQMLYVQHRMHEHISKISSEIFYSGRLETGDREPVHCPWISNLPSRALMVALEGEDKSGFTQFTATRSRFNRRSHDHTVNLVRAIHAASPVLSIAVIAPYRAQIFALRKTLSDLNAKLRVGTVHTMQGSEADIVIWDLVDVREPARSVRAGMLYRDSAGNRLFNVGMTRARELVVLIGDPRTFTHERSGVQAMASAIKRRFLKVGIEDLLSKLPPGNSEDSPHPAEDGLAGDISP